MKTSQDQKWLESLTLELRIHNISGAQIGDALATVKEHLSDSGESAQVAFGSPAEYATHIAASSNAQKVSLKGTITRSVLGLLAFLAFTQATGPWAAGDPMLLGATQLISFALPTLGALSIPYLYDKLLRNFWIFWVLIAVNFGGVLIAALSAPRDSAEAWLSIDPLPVLLVTATIMIIASILDTIANAKDGDDSIIDPLSSPEAARKKLRISRFSDRLVSWIFPISAVFFLGLAFVLR